MPYTVCIWNRAKARRASALGSMNTHSTPAPRLTKKPSLRTEKSRAHAGESAANGRHRRRSDRKAHRACSTQRPTEGGLNMALFLKAVDVHQLTWACPARPFRLASPRPDRGADEPAPPRQGHETAPVPGLPSGAFGGSTPAASLPHRQSRRTPAFALRARSGLPAPRPDRGADEPAPPRQGARLRPFRACLRAPSAARPLPRRCLTGRAEEPGLSPCAPVPGLRSDKARSLRARANGRPCYLD